MVILYIWRLGFLISRKVKHSYIFKCLSRIIVNICAMFLCAFYLGCLNKRTIKHDCGLSMLSLCREDRINIWLTQHLQKGLSFLSLVPPPPLRCLHCLAHSWRAIGVWWNDKCLCDCVLRGFGVLCQTMLCVWVFFFLFTHLNLSIKLGNLDGVSLFVWTAHSILL